MNILWTNISSYICTVYMHTHFHSFNFKKFEVTCIFPTSNDKLSRPTNTMTVAKIFSPTNMLVMKFCPKVLHEGTFVNSIHFKVQS